VYGVKLVDLRVAAWEVEITYYNRMFSNARNMLDVSPAFTNDRIVARMWVVVANDAITTIQKKLREALLVNLGVLAKGCKALMLRAIRVSTTPLATKIFSFAARMYCTQDCFQDKHVIPQDFVGPILRVRTCEMMAAVLGGLVTSQGTDQTYWPVASGHVNRKLACGLENKSQVELVRMIGNDNKVEVHYDGALFAISRANITIKHHSTFTFDYAKGEVLLKYDQNTVPTGSAGAAALHGMQTGPERLLIALGSHFGGFDVT